MATGFSLFGWFSWAVRHHFLSEAMPLGMIMVSLLSVIGIITFSWLLWHEPPKPHRLLFSLFMFSIAAVVFGWSLSATRWQKFGLAFDAKQPNSFVKIGPYRYVRHPFYASYLVFWLGCTVATAHLASAAILIALGALYAVAAIREERIFDTTQFSGEYAEYKQRAGLFWPKRLGQR